MFLALLYLTLRLFSALILTKPS